MNNVSVCCSKSKNVDKKRNSILKDREEYGKFFYRPKNGETGLEVYNRAKTFIHDLKYRSARHYGEHNNVVIVSHGAFIEFFTMYLMDWSIEKLHSIHRPNNCDIIHIRDSHGKYNLETPFQK